MAADFYHALLNNIALNRAVSPIYQPNETLAIGATENLSPMPVFYLLKPTDLDDNAHSYQQQDIKTNMGYDGLPGYGPVTPEEKAKEFFYGSALAVEV